MLLYMGRQITIRINSLQPNYSIIQEIQRSPEYPTYTQFYSQLIGDKYLILGYDNMDEMNLIEINIQMVSQFISRHQHLDIMYIQCIAEESHTDQAIKTIY